MYLQRASAAKTRTKLRCPSLDLSGAGSLNNLVIELGIASDIAGDCANRGGALVVDPHAAGLPELASNIGSHRERLREAKKKSREGSRSQVTGGLSDTARRTCNHHLGQSAQWDGSRHHRTLGRAEDSATTHLGVLVDVAVSVDQVRGEEGRDCAEELWEIASTIK